MAKVAISKERSKAEMDRVTGKDANTKGNKMAKQLLDNFDQFHSMGRIFDDTEIEELLLRQHQRSIDNIDKKPDYPKDLVKFNPSGASKSVMDLYLKGMGYEEQEERYPYHARWTRNSTAVHDVVQRDLLYMEKLLPDAKFTVQRTEEGLPAWEDNVLKWVELEHKGHKFILNGKSDGILTHEPTGTTVGFELKTKTNTIGQVGHFKMKEPASYHVDQCVAYYLLFGVRDHIICYEGVVKDHWHKGAEAKPDIRAFHVYITDEMAEELLDRWAYVAECVANKQAPDDKELGFFSGYKYLAEELDSL